MRTLLQIPFFIVAILMILHGWFGPTLAPKNLATTLSWIHFRGALVLILLIAGNFFCLACPFMLVRNAARKFFRPARNWPRRLRNKWLSLGLFVAILFSYELFDLWSTPWWTAMLIVAYFFAPWLSTDCSNTLPSASLFVPLTIQRCRLDGVPLEVKVRGSGSLHELPD